MDSKKLYTEDSIESLDPLEFTRLKPGVYCGDTTYSTQLLIEIISNSVDEFNLGHGSKINVVVKNGVITVEDEGQGFIPNSMRDDGKTILEAAFSVLNTSGKYRSDGAYDGTSLGSFGIGSKIANFLSNYLKVITWRDGQYEEVHFVEGVFKERETGTCPKSKHGTKISWKPSAEFFTHTEIEDKKIKDLFETITCLCKGLRINYDNNGIKNSYYSKNGISDLVDKNVKGKEIIKNRLSFNFQEGKNKLDLVMTYTSNNSSTIVPYVNTGLTETGPHITQLKTCYTREANKFFREKKWLKDKDANLTGEDLQEGMYLAFNITAAGVSYDAQVKSRVTAIETKPFVEIFTEKLHQWFKLYEKDVKTIADKAILARKAREAAKKARAAVRDTGVNKKKTTLNLPTKLVDCYGKNRSECELLISEGKDYCPNPFFHLSVGSLL